MTAARNQSLDVLRGIAVLMVMCYHVGMSEWGWSGIDLFFVLSGFLISGLLFTDIDRTGSVQLKRFLIRRGFKIYPAFYAFIGLSFLFLPQNKTAILPEVLFLQNYRGGILPEFQSYCSLAFWGHTWSLAVEEHFYVLLPLLLMILVRFKKVHLIPAIAIAMAILCFSLRVITPYHAGRAETTVLVFPSHLRFDSLFAGVALGYLSRYRGEIFSRLTRSRWTVVTSVGVIPALVCKHWFASPLLPSLILTADLVGFCAILISVFNRRIPFGGLISKIGRYSYSIYLWHMPIVIGFGKVPPKRLFQVGSIVLSCLVGIAMSKVIELPALRLRDRLFPSRNSRVPEAELKLVDHHSSMTDRRYVSPEFEG